MAVESTIGLSHIVPRLLGLRFFPKRLDPGYEDLPSLCSTSPHYTDAQSTFGRVKRGDMVVWSIG